MAIKLVKFIFVAYQALFPSTNGTCRFTPTCSKYAVDAVGKYGFMKGSAVTLRRLLSCHPFSKRPYWDPA